MPSGDESGSRRGVPDALGPYRVLRLLGQGGVGAVFLGEDPRTGREVAIKVLHELDPDLLARFEREAELMARVRDPRVVSLIETGRDGARPYLVLEYAPGEDLAHVLARRGALPWQEAVDLVAVAARGLEAAHQQGVVHRDLKPSNLLVTSAGGIKVTDFGVAHARVEGDQRQSLTLSGVLLGTPTHMSPEQILDPRRADARSDVYALGVVLYQCLSGTIPFNDESMLAIMNRVLNETPAPLPPEVPARVAAVVARAMAREPHERHPSAGELADELEALLERPPGSRWGTGVVAAASAGVLLLGVTGAVLASRGPGSPSPSARLDPSAAPSPDSSALRYGTPAFFEQRRELWWKPAEVLLQSRERGETAALHRLAVLVVHDQPALALTVLREAAAAGDPEAMYELSLQRIPDREEWRARAARAVSVNACWATFRRAPRDAAAGAALERAREVGEERAKLGDPVARGFLLVESYSRGDVHALREQLRPGLAAQHPMAHMIQGLILRGAWAREDERIAEHFERAATLGDPRAMVAWARCLLEGTGVEKDPTRAEEWLQRAERLGRGRMVLIERIRLARAERRPDEWQELCGRIKSDPEFFDTDGWCELALHLWDVVNTISEPARPTYLRLLKHALLWAQPDLSLNTRLIYRVAIAYREGLLRSDEADKRVASLCTRAARLGHPDAHAALGLLLVVGIGVERDVPQGLAVLREAAAQGSSEGAFQLGVLHQSGLHGLELDHQRAIELFRASAAKSHPEGLKRLIGLLDIYERWEEGLPWCEREAEEFGLPGRIDQAYFRLRCDPEGEHAAESVRILEENANTSASASLALAALYEAGCGLQRDTERARAYRELAEKIARERKKK